MDVHIFAGSHIATHNTVEDHVLVHRVCCSGPQDFQLNVVDVFEKEHRIQPFQLVESAEIHANALQIKQRFPSLPLLVRLHASNFLVESFKKEYIPFRNKLRFLLGALRRGKWDLGYWRKYNLNQDADYHFVQMADFVSAPTRQMKNWVVSNWKMAPALISVIENPFMENEAFKKARTHNEEQAVIFYGRLNVLKGLITATMAMKIVLKKNPGWIWIIVGDDGTAADGKKSMKQWMQQELKAVSPQVMFYASLPYGQLPAMLQQASIALVPSLFESYSYVTIEAMSAGKAVIGSSGTGIASLIENNVSGKLADPYSVKEWIADIQGLIDDPALRKQFGIAAIEKVEEKRAINKEIIEYYRSFVIKTATH